MIGYGNQKSFSGNTEGFESREVLLRRKQTSYSNDRAPGRGIIDFVLASGSKSKVAILRSLGIDFKVDPADIDETLQAGVSAAEMVCILAEKKARKVSVRNPGSVVLGADSLIQDELGPIGKPADPAEAEEILRRLSGHTHDVFTCLTVVDGATGRAASRMARTTVRFRSLSPQTIQRYIRTGEPMGKAGAYALQGIGALLVEQVDGEHSNVMGLPISTFVETLADLGYELI